MEVWKLTDVICAMKCANGAKLRVVYAKEFRILIIA